jgi:hypothetical protein
MGSVAKIPELAFLAFHNRSFMPFSAHHFCQETIFATEPLFPSFVELAHESFDGKHIPVARTSGDAAQKRELWYAWLPLAAAACSGNRAGLIGEQ